MAFMRGEDTPEKRVRSNSELVFTTEARSTKFKMRRSGSTAICSGNECLARDGKSSLLRVSVVKNHSLIPQRDHGVDAGCSQGRYVAGEQRNERQHQSHGAEGERIGGAYAVEHCAH